ncbi:SDR family oxidoreductase [Sphingobium sp. H39-3-25]|uniref:Quinone oxidoreductase 2 n=1 Tax=Sphingopyxis fribergensis TaxID=1515612 RepID=A0A0A7PGN8_9SPHN|nr:SDR family oxidoreductase [Sphingopyxis fribergensis]AJA07112.1 Quinone oxidoreductase 2 [Sphingopyxis fribergensis]MDF0546605.1 SDR family oxidoreductase [Sphingobium arseniciresistens]
MNIAVTGASGQLGRLAIDVLTARTGPAGIVALARTPDKVADLGIETRAFDYEQAETLAAALKGVDTLILISSSEIGQRVRQHRNVIDAAKAATVKRILYTSLLHADTSVVSLAAEHRETEADLKASGVDFTILRNGWYTENYTSSIHSALQSGVFIGSAGQGKLASATRKDFAEALAIVAMSDGPASKVYELAGDDAWTLSDLAAEISRQTGRTIPYRDLPAADYAAALVTAGLPEGLADAIAGWDVAASQGGLFDDGKQLSKLIGRPTTPLAQAVAHALQ